MHRTDVVCSSQWNPIILPAYFYLSWNTKTRLGHVVPVEDSRGQLCNSLSPQLSHPLLQEGIYDLRGHMLRGSCLKLMEKIRPLSLG